MKTFLSLSVLLFAVASASPVRADDSSPSPAPSAAPGSDLQNNRAKTLEGSRSRWSGQFNLGYSGSSINHPFSEFVPNPRGEDPAPVVNLSGTVSARYRIDKFTTMGLGTGVVTETPFQGPKNTSFSEPYVDVARSFKTGPIHNHADLLMNLYTSSQYYDEGYRLGFTLSDESFYEFPFGLTAGLAFGLDYNTFASGYIPSHHVVWDLATSPYFEYSLTKRINLRSVIGIGFRNKENFDSFFNLESMKLYQTLGLGISATDAVFVYTFVRFLPISENGMASDTATVGFSTIINLF